MCASPFFLITVRGRCAQAQVRSTSPLPAPSGASNLFFCFLTFRAWRVCCRDSVELWGSLRRTCSGGSWANNQDNARAVYRNNNDPGNRNNNIGFKAQMNPVRTGEKHRRAHLILGEFNSV